MTRSISIAAVRPTGCRAAASAPASCASRSLVAECVAAMVAAVDVPVTVKCRIGVDEQEPREALFAFAEAVKAAGAAALIVHARKAWLEGLSPKDNRSIPPLDYELVHALKRAHPDWPIILNGGLADLDAARAHLEPCRRNHARARRLSESGTTDRRRSGAVRRAGAGRRRVRGDRSLHADDRAGASARRAPARLHPPSRTGCLLAGLARAPSGRFSRPRRSAPAPGSRCCARPFPAWRDGEDVMASDAVSRGWRE